MKFNYQLVHVKQVKEEEEKNRRHHHQILIVCKDKREKEK